MYLDIEIYICLLTCMHACMCALKYFILIIVVDTDVILWDCHIHFPYLKTVKNTLFCMIAKHFSPL